MIRKIDPSSIKATVLEKLTDAYRSRTLYYVLLAHVAIYLVTLASFCISFAISA